VLEGARIAVIVPAYNEAALLPRTLDAMPSFVDSIIVVDDASEDSTWQCLQSWQDPRLIAKRHDANRGVGAAIVTGYQAAFEQGNDVAAVMAGDAQMHPDDLAPLVSAVVRGDADYAKGDRLAHPKARQLMPWTRWVGNHALSWLTSVACGAAVRDSQCGYTALSKEAARRLDLGDLWPRYGYPNDLLSRILSAGLAVRDITVRPVYAEEKSGIDARHALGVIPYVLARSWLRRRLQRTEAGSLTDPHS